MKNKESINYNSETEQLKNLRNKILLNDFQIDNEQYLEQLIQTLESTQKEWQKAIFELKQKQKEYKNLISQVNRIKQIIIDDAFKSNVSIFAKLKIHFLRYKKC